MAPKMAPAPALTTTAAHKEQEAGADISSAPSRFVPETLEDVQRIARMFYFSGLMKRTFYKDASQAGVRDAIAGISTMILYGAELGLSPMQAMRSMHVIEGQATLSAAGKVALVKRSPRCLYFRVIEESDEHCTCETVRVESDGKAGPPQRLTVRAWWKDEPVPAAQKGTLYVLPTLGKDGRPTAPWERTPGRMVKARCTSWLCDNVYEDVTLGLYSAEEVVDFGERRTQAQLVDDIFAMVDAEPARPGRVEPTDENAEAPAPERTVEREQPVDDGHGHTARVEDLRRRIAALSAGEVEEFQRIREELKKMPDSAEKLALVREHKAALSIVNGTAQVQQSGEGGA